jgi:outer membrane lipoprotein-sorting protein
MIRIYIIFFVLNFYNPVFSSSKENIISQLQLIDNLSFNFIQTIDDKNENGKCILQYPKKIWCKYKNSNKKIMVSNGKSLVIKTLNTGSYYRYPLNKTPLEFLLDKEYLISKIEESEPRDIDNKYLNFKIFENNNEINIFFDKKDLNWTDYVSNDQLFTYILKEKSEIAGYFELLFNKQSKEAEIAYFGILEEYYGKKLGGYLLSEAIKSSFNMGSERVWVHTCSLDHKNALKNYLARGMKNFKSEILIR